MEDVIKRSGNTFGTNEAMILSQLSLAAVPTAAVIFLDIITNEVPEVCIYKFYKHKKVCEEYLGLSFDVCELNRTRWDYVNVDYTIVAKFDLLCNPSWMLTMTYFCFFLGMMLGCFFAGLLSDCVGRKPSLMVFLFGEGLFLCLLIVVGSYQWWLVLRFLTGVCIGYFVVCKILIIEGLKIQYRHSFLAAIWSCFAAGILLLGILDFVFSRYIDMIACIVILIVFLWGLYLFGIEESLRWLLVKRKKEEASYLLGKISYTNKVDLPSYDEIPKPRDDDFTIQDIFRISESRYLMTILLILSTLSFFLLFNYTLDNSTLYFSQITLSWNLVINSSLHFTGVMLAAVSCYFWGRRPTVQSLHIVILLLMIASIVLTTSWPILTMATALGIRCLAAGLVYFCSLYSLEVFATPLRAKAMGLILSGAAVGGLIASITDFFEDDQEVNFTFLIVETIVVFVVTILTFSLRETKGFPLPERVDAMPQILPYNEWCQCTADNPENHPLLNSPQFSHIHINNAVTTENAESPSIGGEWVTPMSSVCSASIRRNSV